MVSRVIKFFWPTFTDEEVKKYGLLALSFLCTIGAYWLMKPIKDGIFFNIVGGKYQPIAKMLSVVSITLLVFIYTRLVDIFQKQNLFYIIGTFYTVIFAIVAYLIGLPTNGDGALNPVVLKGLGWFVYLAIESFGSIMVALFWSFTASVSDPESAKKCYPFVFAAGQIGGILSPLIAWKYAEVLGIRVLTAIITILIILIMVSIKIFMKVMPRDEVYKSGEGSGDKTKAGFFEGIKLILTRPYLLGIFGIVTLYEIVNIIVDYQMKMQASAVYTTAESLTSFMGAFGVATNGAAFLLALLGTSYLLKRFGLRFCLLAFPVSLGIAISVLYCFIRFGVEPHFLLWFTFGVMVLIRCLSYALNNPSKEMLYVPTSKDAKFKSKGWIDMFGSRIAKAESSTLNVSLVSAFPTAVYLAIGTAISLGLIGAWIVVAIFVSGTYKKLVKTGEIIK